MLLVTGHCSNFFNDLERVGVNCHFAAAFGPRALLSVHVALDVVGRCLDVGHSESDALDKQVVMAVGLS